jgi:hypothetical protein
MLIVDQILGLFGICVENRQPRPGTHRAETTPVLSAVFDADCQRQELQHEIAQRGGPRIPNNSESLGFVREHRSSDWLP